MNNRIASICITAFVSLSLFSCGTSTGTRYLQEEAQHKKDDKDSGKISENFDLTRYHPKMDIKEKTKTPDSAKTKVWYSYNENPGSSHSDTSEAVIKTMPGFRVLVLSTDNLDEANNMRSDVYFKTGHSAVYVVFDPPFYKVEAGDFTDINDAKNFSFKLKQMGYNDITVINETVNKFK
jgi:hypothetical protein